MAVLSIALGTVVFGLGLWGGIKLVDQGNEHNSLLLAGILGLFFSTFGYAAGMLFFLLPVVALGMLLLKFYQLEIMQTIVVMVIMFLLNVAVSYVVKALLTALGMATG